MRSLLRLAVLTAAGCQVPEADEVALPEPELGQLAEAPIPEVQPQPPNGSIIPEVQPVQPGPTPRPTPSPNTSKAQLYAGNRSIPLELKAPQTFDLRDAQQRVAAVTWCLDQSLYTKCDLRAVRDPTELLKRNPGAYLGPDMDLRNVYNACRDQPATGGPCNQPWKVNAQTHKCEPDGPPQCRKGRPLGRPLDYRVAEVDAEGFWVRAAQEEHASVAAFARHVLELMSVGAPMSLVQAATQAQLDEIRHTKLALELAGLPDLRFGPLAGAPPRTSLEDILEGVVLEGCLNETLSAAEAVEHLERATDPRIRAALQEIARDEAQHAALSWRTLRWGLPLVEPATRARLLGLLERPSGANGWVWDTLIDPARDALAA